jgi:ribose-phosphate pyrophosphokinase
VRIDEDVRDCECYVVQSTGFAVNDNFMELLFWLDAARRASAASVTAVIPFFAYGKGDKRDEPGTSIRARVCADALQAAGAERVVTMDLHKPQIEGFFSIPVDDVPARPALCDAVRSLGLDRPVVVAPDAGFAASARRFADCLGTDLAVLDKTRNGHNGEMETAGMLGDVTERAALVVDDFTVTGGTLARAAEMVRAQGATDVCAAVTHGLLTAECLATVQACPVRKLLVTDTVEARPGGVSERVQTVSVAQLLAEAIAGGSSD